MSTIAAGLWQPYLRPSIEARPTAKARYFVPIGNAAPSELSQAAKEPKLLALHTKLDEIASLPDDWDGHGSVRPDPLAVENARQFLEEAYRQSVAVGAWQNPYVSSSEDGEFVFEWWNGIKKLTVYIGRQQSSYVKSWGPHVVDNMEDGVLPADGISTLWVWLSE